MTQSSMISSSMTIRSNDSIAIERELIRAAGAVRAIDALVELRRIRSRRRAEMSGMTAAIGVIGSVAAAVAGAVVTDWLG